MIFGGSDHALRSVWVQVNDCLLVVVALRATATRFEMERGIGGDVVFRVRLFLNLGGRAEDALTANYFFL